MWTGVGASAEKRPNIRVDPFGPWPRMIAWALESCNVPSLDSSSRVRSAATILGHGPRGSPLMLGRFTAEAPTPVHNHNSWGVLCVIRGRDRHILWARQDDGSQVDKAQLRIIQTRELGPGDVAWFPEVPGDIHSQQGIGEAAWELVYFGRDPMALPRLYFDPDRGRVEVRAAF